MKLRALFVDQVRRFALEAEAADGRGFVSIAVRNSLVEYCEHYEVDRQDFIRFLVDPTLAHELVGKAKRRELDHRLLFPPGRERGVAD
jgi:hypothetical protein